MPALGACSKRIGSAPPLWAAMRLPTLESMAKKDHVSGPGDSLPRVIDPDDPLRRRPAHEMDHLVLFLTPEEAVAVKDCAARCGMSVGEAGLRALAYGLTVLEAGRQEEERRLEAARHGSGEPAPTVN